MRRRMVLNERVKRELSEKGIVDTKAQEEWVSQKNDSLRKAISDVMDIITQEGMTFRDAKSVIDNVQQMIVASSEDFLKHASAKEALESRTAVRY